MDDLADDAQGLLVAIATEDADAGVRAAAVSRLTVPATLRRIAETDTDERVRADATAVLRDIAVAGTDPDLAQAALSGLSATKDLGEVARAAALEAVGRSALERLDAQKTIAMVSRRSDHAAVRQAALDRVTDGDELLAVATKSEHRDIAVAAFERLLSGAPASRELLKTVATRARAKPVARRARAALAALDAEPAPAPVGGRGQRRERLCETVETLTGASDSQLLHHALADAEREWAALDVLALAVSAQQVPLDRTVESGEVDPAVAERWSAGLAAAREHLVRLDLARSEADRARERHLSEVAARTAVCERLSGLLAAPPENAEELLANLATLSAAWAALASESAEPAATTRAITQLQGRFDALLAQADTVLERRRSAGDRAARLTELTAALEEISGIATTDDLKRRWAGPHAEWRELVKAAEPAEVEGLVARVERAQATRTERLEAMRAERLKREEANLFKHQRRCEEWEQVVADEALELPSAERALRATRSLLGNLGHVPRQGRDTLTARLRKVQTELTGRVRELRGLVEWKQWANLTVQAALCQRLEALQAVEDDGTVRKEYGEVMLGWRQASEVQPGEGDDIWKRFKLAHDAIQPRVEADLAKQNAARQESLAQKQALCEEAERLAVSTDWVATAQRLTAMQGEWKRVGPATRKQEREVWNRFRAACGAFFARRRDDLVERKQVWSKNGALKEALCKKAEALADETDLPAAKDVVRQLQKDWKAVGPVRRARSEALWTRFRAACDQVFNRSQQASAAESQEKIAARTAVSARLDALVPSADAAPDAVPEGLADQVAAIRAEWRQLAPVPGPQALELAKRFEASLDSLLERVPAAFAGTDLDPARNHGALERLCERVEALLDASVTSPVADGRSPAEVLAARLREALATNTMGARVDPAVQRRATIDEVKRIQTERQGLGVVLGESGRRLSDRFRAACDRFFQLNPAPAARTPQSRDGGHQPPRSKKRTESGRP